MWIFKFSLRRDVYVQLATVHLNEKPVWLSWWARNVFKWLVPYPHSSQSNFFSVEWTIMWLSSPCFHLKPRPQTEHMCGVSLECFGVCKFRAPFVWKRTSQLVQKNGLKSSWRIKWPLCVVIIRTVNVKFSTKYRNAALTWIRLTLEMWHRTGCIWYLPYHRHWDASPFHRADSIWTNSPGMSSFCWEPVESSF